MLAPGERDPYRVKAALDQSTPQSFPRRPRPTSAHPKSKSPATTPVSTQAPTPLPNPTMSQPYFLQLPGVHGASNPVAIPTQNTPAGPSFPFYSISHAPPGSQPPVVHNSFSPVPPISTSPPMNITFSPSVVPAPPLQPSQMAPNAFEPTPSVLSPATLNRVMPGHLDGSYHPYSFVPSYSADDIEYMVNSRVQSERYWEHMIKKEKKVNRTSKKIRAEKSKFKENVDRVSKEIAMKQQILDQKSRQLSQQQTRDRLRHNLSEVDPLQLAFYIKKAVNTGDSAPNPFRDVLGLPKASDSKSPHDNEDPIRQFARTVINQYYQKSAADNSDNAQSSQNPNSMPITPELIQQLVNVLQQSSNNSSQQSSRNISRSSSVSSMASSTSHESETEGDSEDSQNSSDSSDSEVGDQNDPEIQKILRKMSTLDVILHGPHGKSRSRSSSATPRSRSRTPAAPPHREMYLPHPPSHLHHNTLPPYPVPQPVRPIAPHPSPYEYPQHPYSQPSYQPQMQQRLPLSTPIHDSLSKVDFLLRQFATNQSLLQNSINMLQKLDQANSQPKYPISSPHNYQPNAFAPFSPLQTFSSPLAVNDPREVYESERFYTSPNLQFRTQPSHPEIRQQDFRHPEMQSYSSSHDTSDLQTSDLNDSETNEDSFSAEDPHENPEPFEFSQTKSPLQSSVYLLANQYRR